MKDRAVVATVSNEHDHGLRMRDLRDVRGSGISTIVLSCVKGMIAFCFLCKEPFAVGGGGFQPGWRAGAAAYAGSPFLLSSVLDILATLGPESLLALLCSPSPFVPFVSEARATEHLSLSSSSSSAVEPDDRLRIGYDAQLASALREVNRIELPKFNCGGGNGKVKAASTTRRLGLFNLRREIGANGANVGWMSLILGNLQILYGTKYHKYGRLH